MIAGLDAIDLRLVARLQGDGRVTNADLARELGMAPSAVLERVRKLEAEGVVRGYLARIDPAALDRPLLAFVHLRTAERVNETRIATEVARIRGVLEVHDVAGDDCYLLKVRARDTAELHRMIREDIGAVAGVVSTRTTIVLKSFLERFDLPLPQGADSLDAGKDGIDAPPRASPRPPRVPHDGPRRRPRGRRERRPG